MGGSLASHGGQNPIEAIRLGAAVVHGPHVWNFAEIYGALDAAHGAEQVADADGVDGMLARAGLRIRLRAKRSRMRAPLPSANSAARSSEPWRRSSLT